MLEYGILFDYNGVLAGGERIHPVAKDLLQKLQPEFSLGLVTGASRSGVEPALMEAGIEHFFQVIITADDTNRSKPDPDGYLKGTKGLHLPPENVVVVEDTPAGIEAAAAAGLKSIVVLHTSGRDRLAAATRIVETIEEITPYLVREVLRQNV